MKRIISIIEKFLHIMTWFGGIATIVMMMLTVLNIVLRKFFNSGITGVIDISEVCLVCLVWFSVGLCAYTNNMIEVDLFKFPKWYLKCTHILSIAMCFFMAYANFLSAESSRCSGATTATLRIHRFPFIYLISFGFLSIAIAQINNIIKEISANWKK